jgi:hypothetical protein
MIIAKHEFRTVPLSGEAYEFTTEFSDSENNPHSNITVVLNRSRNSREGKIVDVYSQNGKCDITDPRELLGDGPSHLFHKHDIKALNRAATKLKTETTPSDRSVLVLDLKDSEGSYLKPDQIQNAEKVVCDFMSNKDLGGGIGKHAKRAHEIFHKILPIDHVLLEGTLKTQLLKFASESQAEYFLGNSSHFCEFTEPFINALKLGHEIPGIQDPSSFFSPIKDKNPFKPGVESVVHYPESYADLYSPDSPIPRALRGSFRRLTMEVDTLHKTTSMIINESET